MRIRTQLFALIGSFAVVFGGFVVLSWNSQAERAEDSVYRPVLETKDLIADVLPPPAFILEAHALVLDLAINRDANAREAAVAHWRTLEKDFRERREFWLKTLESGELKTAVEKADREAEQYFAVVDQAYLPALAAGDQAKAAEVLRAELKPLFALHRASIDRVVALAEERTKRQEAEAAGAVRATKTMLVGVGAAAIALSLFFGWLLSNRIVRRMGELGAALRRVAEGDYTVEVKVSAHDELGELEESLNATVQTGRAMLTQLRQSSAEVGSASLRLAESTAEVAEGAQRQADLVSRTVTDLDGLSTRVRENSSQASQASTSALQTQNYARSGADVMLKSRESMAAISGASRKVQQIISVIDEFAFQTNIVALNAAVEAARAGEAGRGFAVVANEVRTLAQRSAESAREVRSLVTDTISKVKAGEALAKDSEEAFQQIGVATAHLTQLVDAMTQSFQGQVDAIGSVTRELSTISTVTQRNAAESEQLSGMSEVLKTQSHQLDALTRRFVVDVGELTTSAPDKLPPSEPSFEAPRVQPRRRGEVRPRAN